MPKKWRHWLDASPAPRPQSRTLEFIGVDEDRPASRWKALFDETWPEYERWWLAHEANGRPTRAQAEAALSEHMPELVPDRTTGWLSSRARRHRRRDADPVEPARRSSWRARRSWSPTGHRRAGAEPKLRLRPAPVRGDRLPQPLGVAAGDGDRRLPVGIRSRRQRSRPRGLTDLRRAARGRRRLRCAARDPLPARGVRRRAAGIEVLRDCPISCRTTSPWATGTARSRPSRRARPAGAGDRAVRGDQPPRDGRVARARRLGEQHGSGSSYLQKLHAGALDADGLVAAMVVAAAPRPPLGRGLRRPSTPPRTGR